MLRALWLLMLLSSTLRLVHPADTDAASDLLIRNVFLEFLVNKDKRIPIPPTHTATVGSVTSIPLTTVRLYLRNNPSPFANTRTDIGIPPIVNLWILAPHIPQGATILAPALMEHYHEDSPEPIADNQLGRMLSIEGRNMGLATFKLGTTYLTNEQLLDPATGKGLILDAVRDITAAGGGGQMAIMEKIIARLAPHQPPPSTALAHQRQHLFDANMAGYKERTKRKRGGENVLGAGPGADVGD
ncbi:hypothetical protein MMC15_003740 [Xylographa vitiligo]|nr:hypothetical protein [Xylographa vitiligo]